MPTIRTMMLTTSVLALCGLVTPLPAAAQASGVADGQAASAPEQHTPPPPPPSADETTDIVVTALKRSSSLQDVPAAVSAIDAESLQRRGITRAADLMFAVPSVQVGTIGGATNVSVRGISNSISASNGAASVAIHFDGVYQPLPSMGDVAQVDLERVEVLRGPQGTLYGRNANGGAINYISKAPTDELGGYIQAGYGTYDTVRLQGVLNVPISDSVRIRAVGDYNNRGDGFVKNIIPGNPDVDRNESIYGRLKLSADLTSNLTLDLTGSQLHQNGNIFYVTLRNQPNAAALIANPYLVGAISPQEPWRTSTNNPQSSKRDYTFASAVLTWNVGDLGPLRNFSVKSTTGWQRSRDEYFSDDDGTNIEALIGHRLFKDKTFTQEVNINGSLGPLDLILGGFLMRDKYNYLFHFDFPLGYAPLPPESVINYEQKPFITNSKAVFGDATLNLGRLKLLGGLRYSYDKLRNVQYNYLRLGPTNISVTCPGARASIAFDSLTPRAGFQYQASRDNSFYGTYSKGFKDGGFNRNTCNQTYKPETITAYEVGIKNRLLDGAATLNLSAFYYDYTNLQLTQSLGLGAQINNAATARVKGVEVEASWKINANWAIDGNLSLIDARFRSFLNFDPLNPGLGVQDLSGNRLNNAPSQSANIGISYDSGQGPNGRLFARVDLSQRARFYFREFNTRDDSQAPYALLNASVTWDSPDELYRVRLFATNLTNKPYITALTALEAVGSRYMNWGAPRQVGFEVRRNF